MKQVVLMLLALSVFAPLRAQSAEEQAARQARSVHLAYQDWGSEAKIFLIQATIDDFARGSYCCLLGFTGGYMGVQELRNGKHIAIFSVWEPGDPFDFGAKPEEVDLSKRTRPIYAGKDVEVSRFGGEGTGGKSMIAFPWERGKPITMAVSASSGGAYRTHYTGWIWYEAEQRWFRMATFSSLVGKGEPAIRAPYSFLEDFRRDVASRDDVRSARFSPLWTYTGSEWIVSTEARFTADGNALETVDAGPSAAGFWMATGGKTINRTTKLWDLLSAGGVPNQLEAPRNTLTELVRLTELSDRHFLQEEAAAAAPEAK